MPSHVSADRPIELLYTGGIDSTAVLVAMLQTAPSQEILVRMLRLKLARRALTEYPLFFERYIDKRIEYTLLDDDVDICEHLDAGHSSRAFDILTEQLVSGALATPWPLRRTQVSQ